MWTGEKRELTKFNANVFFDCCCGREAKPHKTMKTRKRDAKNACADPNISILITRVLLLSLDFVELKKEIYAYKAKEHVKNVNQI